MPTLFEELKRRNVFRVAIAYIIVGWVVMQVAEFLSPLLRSSKPCGFIWRVTRR